MAQPTRFCTDAAALESNRARCGVATRAGNRTEKLPSATGTGLGSRNPLATASRPCRRAQREWTNSPSRNAARGTLNSVHQITRLPLMLRPRIPPPLLGFGRLAYSPRETSPLDPIQLGNPFPTTVDRPAVRFSDADRLQLIFPEWHLRPPPLPSLP